MSKHHKPVPSAAAPLTATTERMKAEGYRVFPASFFDTGTPLDTLFDNVLNTAGVEVRMETPKTLSPRPLPSEGEGVVTAQCHQHGTSEQGASATPHPATHTSSTIGGGNPLTRPGGYLMPGAEIPVGNDRHGNHIGTPGSGYITWGAWNNLPNFIATANAMLPYTAAALKFNVDTLVGLGLRPMYRYYTSTGGSPREETIPYDDAGPLIRERISALYQKIVTLTASIDRPIPTDKTELPTADDTPSRDDADTDDWLTLPSAPTGQEAPHADTPERTAAPATSEQLTFQQFSDRALRDTVSHLLQCINDLKRDLGIWQKTQKWLRRFLRETNTQHLLLRYATDLIHYGIFFPEIDLAWKGSRDNSDTNWNPPIVTLGYRNALQCRLERYDQDGVSRHTYISNQWLSSLSPTEAQDVSIDALPALDPAHPVTSLADITRKFRMQAQKQALSQPSTEESEDPIRDENGQGNSQSSPLRGEREGLPRPCRIMLPTAYPTAGRNYYPVPPYWSIYNDVYKFADNILRYRAQRKANESMFGYVVYVHADYLDKLANQINAQQTDEERMAVKNAEIQKIKRFLADKRNNGQTFAACTFTGSDGKDHDAFRIEQVSMANKAAAEADKTEIADISSIILFALECHPDLIGATPGGASSKGGTYQREMFQLKQAKMAATQQLLLSPFCLLRDYNQLDPHLDWHIMQRTLTTLDRSHSGTIDE